MSVPTKLALAATLMLAQAAHGCTLGLASLQKKAYPTAVDSKERNWGVLDFTVPGNPARHVYAKDSIICKVLPQTPALSLIGVELSKDAGASDYDIFVIDTASGAIRHRWLEAGVIEASGTRRFSSLDFDTIKYSTVPGRSLFGVLATREDKGDGRKSSIDTLTLYVLNGVVPVPVLQRQTGVTHEILTRLPAGVINGHCGDRKEEWTEIKPLPTLHNGLNDLKFTLTKATVKCMMQNDEEKWIDIESTPSTVVLQFDGVKYRAP